MILATFVHIGMSCTTHPCVIYADTIVSIMLGFTITTRIILWHFSKVKMMLIELGMGGA